MEKFYILCRVSKLIFCQKFLKVKQNYRKFNNHFPLRDYFDLVLTNTRQEEIAFKNFDNHIILIGVGKDELRAFDSYASFKILFSHHILRRYYNRR